MDTIIIVIIFVHIIIFSFRKFKIIIEARP